MLKEYDENLIRLQKIANDRNLVLNPDQARKQKVISLMTENNKAVGEYICPCKQKNKPLVKCKDILYPCSDMMAEIARDGHCHCRLFFSSEAAISNIEQNSNY